MITAMEVRYGNKAKAIQTNSGEYLSQEFIANLSKEVSGLRK
jgi:hypothetical protein